jgi:hypothetical protein
MQCKQGVAKPNRTTQAAATTSNIDAATAMRSASSELQTTIEPRTMKTHENHRSNAFSPLSSLLFSPLISSVLFLSQSSFDNCVETV